MLELELEVVLVGVGAEPDLLDHDLRGVRLHLLGPLLLLILVLLVVQDLAHVRVGLVGDLDEIKFEFLRQGPCLGDRVDARLGNVVPDQADLLNRDLVIDLQFILIFFRTALLVAVRLRSRRLRSVRRCDSSFLLFVK